MSPSVLRLPLAACARGVVAVVAAALAAVALGDAAPARADDPVVLAAGDIASCSSAGDEATAALLAGRPGTVLTLGDNVYNNGTATEFATCYAPSWGAELARTRPAPGNHDYNTAGASGYFGYFGAAAGDPAKGYYSFDVGAWHLVALNSNCAAIGGCGAGSAQETWLRADLAAHPADCTLAYWHHPRFSSGLHGDQAAMQPIFQALDDLDADIVLAGHDHDYERFAPQTAAGVADAAGVREFVVGTGGRSHYGFGVISTNSEVRNGDTYGILQLTLHAASYDWQFIPEAGKTFTDSGSAACVTAPPLAVGGIAELPAVRARAATEPRPAAFLSAALAMVALAGSGAVLARAARRLRR